MASRAKGVTRHICYNGPFEGHKIYLGTRETIVFRVKEWYGKYAYFNGMLRWVDCDY